VELVRRAKDEGIRVTAEVTPHHLVFHGDDLVTYDTNLKVNPPLGAPRIETRFVRPSPTDHRRDRDGPCTPRGGGEGGGVRSVAARDDRNGNGSRPSSRELVEPAS